MMKRVGIFQVGRWGFLSENFPVGNFPGGDFPGTSIIICYQINADKPQLKLLQGEAIYLDRLNVLNKSLSIPLSKLNPR